MKVELKRDSEFKYEITVCSGVIGEEYREDTIFESIVEHCMKVYTNTECLEICRQVNEQIRNIELSPQLEEYLENINKVMVKRGLSPEFNVKKIEFQEVKAE